MHRLHILPYYSIREARKQFGIKNSDTISKGTVDIYNSRLSVVNHSNCDEMTRDAVESAVEQAYRLFIMENDNEKSRSHYAAIFGREEISSSRNQRLNTVEC